MAGLGAAMEPKGATVDDGEQPNVTPEEQAEYEQIVNNALEIIYPEGEEALSPQVKEGLTGSDKPVLNLATTAVTIITGLVESAKQAGKALNQDVLFHAGAAILEELAEAAEAFKIHDYSEEDIERALYLAVDMYREGATQAGDINPDELKAGFEELKAANDRGELDQVLPGAVEHAKKMPQQMPDEAAGEEEDAA